MPSKPWVLLLVGICAQLAHPTHGWGNNYGGFLPTTGVREGIIELESETGFVPVIDHALRLRHFQTISATSANGVCMDYCQSKAECAVFEFNRHRNTCYFKSEVRNWRTYGSVTTYIKQDRRWKVSGDPDGGIIGSRRPGVGPSFQFSYHQNFDFECPDNMHLYTLSSKFDQDKMDRKWRFWCADVYDAQLKNCRKEGSQGEIGKAWTYTVPAGTALTGLDSQFYPGAHDRQWQARICDVECEKHRGYVRTGARGCKLANCGELTLENGITDGQCQGNFGDKCTYKECDEGFRLTSSGFSKERECIVDELRGRGQWNGGNRVCENINECTEGTHGCESPAVCKDTPGAYICECPVPGVGLDESGRACDTEGITAQIARGPTWLQFKLKHIEAFDTFTVQIQEWALDKVTRLTIPGYPKELGREDVQELQITGLRSGRRFRVVVTPHGDTGPLPALGYVGGDDADATDLITTCGCEADGLTGKPSDLFVRQHHGRVLFEWKDQSRCESGFGFSRDGVSLVSTYEVHEQQPCGVEHSPVAVYDDLARYSEDTYQDESPGKHFALPQGIVFLPASFNTEEQRYAFPRELDPQGEAQADNSTTGRYGADEQHLERGFKHGVTSPISRRGECASLCIERSDWCVAIVLQQEDRAANGSRLLCHQLDKLVPHDLNAFDGAVSSYAATNVNETVTAATGQFLFEGSEDDCVQVCSARADCVMIAVGNAFCAVLDRSTPLAAPAPQAEGVTNAITSYRRRIRGSTPGTGIRYCVAALNPQGYEIEGYNSGPSCTTFSLRWEAVVRGTVRVGVPELYIPVEGVRVDFEVGHVKGSRMTNVDGEFEMHILSRELIGRAQHLRLCFSKQSGSISHTFKCGGKRCTCQTLLIEHLRFDHKLEVLDTTSAPFSGRLTIAGTEHEEFKQGCPLRDVTVCLQDRLAHDRVLGCTATDALGFYKLPVPIGSSVFVDLSFSNGSHVFRRAPTDDSFSTPTGSSSREDITTGRVVLDGYYDITEEKVWERVDFQDVTTISGKVDVSGGLCNLTLGQTTLAFGIATCPSWERTETTAQRVSTWRLPAHIISVRIEDVNGPGGTGQEIVDYFDAVLPERSLHLDLRHPQEARELHPSVRFEYHPRPWLSIEFDQQQARNCSYADGVPIRVLPQNIHTTATVRVLEEYGEDVGTCDAVPGKLIIENQLGESPDAPRLDTIDLPKEWVQDLTRCYRPCTLDTVMDSVTLSDNSTVLLSNSRVELRLMTGLPEITAPAGDFIPPFTKLFRATMASEPYAATPTVAEAWVVVTGDRSPGVGETVAIPRYQPLLVVQDPPGGLSTVAYSSTHAKFTLESHTLEKYGGLYVDLETTPFKVKKKMEACAGLGFMLCQSAADIKQIPLTIKSESESTGGKRLPGDNHEKHGTWSFAVDLTTSDNAMLAGEPSDMFLVPALNIAFLRVITVAFEPDTCQVTNTTEIRWALEHKDNTEAFAWVTAHEIRQNEIGNLEKLLAEEQAKEEPSLERVSRLTEAINAWTETLANNHQVRQRAANGELEPVQRMWQRQGDYSIRDSISEEPENGLALAPHELLDQAKHVDGSSASDTERAELERTHTIRFSGGGSMYQFTHEWEKETSALKGSRQSSSQRTGATLSFGLNFFGIGSSFKLSPLDIAGSESTHELTNGVRKGGSVAFTLGDADAFDVFDVAVFKHPQFGTFVFHTAGGYSSCPHENGTFALEQPGISVLSRPHRPVLPHEPAVFELLLKNEADLPTDLVLYSLNWDNSDGLQMKIDGRPFAGDFVFPAFEPGSRYITLLVYRGPTKYKYKPLTLWFSSLCEQERVGESGYLSYEPKAEFSVEIEVEYLQPCSPVRIVGELGETGLFEANQALNEQEQRPGQLRVVAFNPDVARRSWSEDERLDEIVIEFKPADDHVWRPARDRDGNVLEISAQENEFGYITSWWDVSAITEGDYQLRVRAQCGASVGETPEGFDAQYSQIVRGVIDRRPPRILGFSEPANEVHLPGDDTLISFDERLRCSRPYRFVVSMAVEELQRVFDNRNIVLYCEGNTITVSLRHGFSWETVNGRRATLTVSGVEDVSSNAIPRAIVHDFQFADLDVANLDVGVSGLALDVPFTDGLEDDSSEAFRSLSALVEQDVAATLRTELSRVQVTAIEPTDPQDYDAGVLISMQFRRSGSGTSTSASQLAVQFEQVVVDGPVAAASEDLVELSVLDRISASSDFQTSVMLDAERQGSAAATAQRISGHSLVASTEVALFVVIIVLNISILLALWCLRYNRYHANKVTTRVMRLDGPSDETHCKGFSDELNQRRTSIP